MHISCVLDMFGLDLTRNRQSVTNQNRVGIASCQWTNAHLIICARYVGDVHLIFFQNRVNIVSCQWTKGLRGRSWSKMIAFSYVWWRLLFCRFRILLCNFRGKSNLKCLLFLHLLQRSCFHKSNKFFVILSVILPLCCHFCAVCKGIFRIFSSVKLECVK